LGEALSALLAGIFAGGILTVATDIVLHVTGVFPPWGQPTGDALLLLATAYRIPFNIAGVTSWRGSRRIGPCNTFW
jgi:hypothetical protein